MNKKMDREEAYNLYHNEGVGFTEIAKRLGVSRQRVHQVITGYTTRKNYKVEKRECYICGIESRLDVHHINRDTHDNGEDNLKVLCAKCHCFLHKIEDGNKRCLFLSEKIISMVNKLSKDEKLTPTEIIIKAISIYKRVKENIRKKQKRVTFERVIREINKSM